jgi:predicted membrane metal-binding protein
VAALYYFRLAGRWRIVYICGAALALYLNVFVGMVQAFQKIGPLHALAPSGKEPAFFIAHLLVLAIFIVLGVIAGKRFNPIVVARVGT